MGYEYGDAQNIAVRCFLNQFSKNFQYFDEYYKNKTLEYFDNKCPYTDVELTSANMVRDHVIPFNKEGCGLHVFGNVLIVDKKANSSKSSKPLEEYLKNEPERLAKIQKFIKVTGYLEIHKKYQEYLRKTCNELYKEIGVTINDRYLSFKANHLKDDEKYNLLAKSRKQQTHSDKMQKCYENIQNYTKPSNQTKYQNNTYDDKEREYLIAYCFSKFEHYSLYHDCNQDKAFSIAASKLGINKNTLKNYRDYYDAHIDNPRSGWWQKPLPTGMKNAKNKFDIKNKVTLLEEAKSILGIKY